MVITKLVRKDKLHCLQFIGDHSRRVFFYEHTSSYDQFAHRAAGFSCTTSYFNSCYV